MQGLQGPKEALTICFGGRGALIQQRAPTILHHRVSAILQSTSAESSRRVVGGMPSTRRKDELAAVVRK
jgi:hypothetical protein